MRKEDYHSGAVQQNYAVLKIKGAAIKQLWRRTVTDRREIGRMLVEFQQQCPEHTWQVNLRDHIGIPLRTAQTYIQFFRTAKPEATTQDLEQLWEEMRPAGAQGSGGERRPPGALNTNSVDNESVDEMEQPVSNIPVTAPRVDGAPEPIAQSEQDGAETAIVDEAGNSVPKHATEAIKMASDFKKIAQEIDDIREKIKALSLSAAGAHVSVEEAQVHAKNLKSLVLQWRPSHVCPYCQGKAKECKCCQGRGWTLAHVYKAFQEQQK